MPGGIVVEHVTKRFDDVLAVDELSFSVAPGEVYGLLGGNGAGKTTALRLIVGLLEPTSGRLSVAGVDVAADPAAAKSRLGFATASAGLYPRLTVRELLAFVAAAHGLSRAAAHARIATVTAALDLAAILDRRCDALSTGQRQRASLARAVLHDPAVLVLDEPTAGLDVLASRSLRDYVSAERDRGKTIVLSTHYLTEAELLCDRVGLLHRGRLLAEGAPNALRAEAGVATLEEALLALVARAPATVSGEERA
jgi:ABC-type multidrug transport system ATPase subunit